MTNVFRDFMKLFWKQTILLKLLLRLFTEVNWWISKNNLLLNKLHVFLKFYHTRGGDKLRFSHRYLTIFICLYFDSFS